MGLVLRRRNDTAHYYYYYFSRNAQRLSAAGCRQHVRAPLAVHNKSSRSGTKTRLITNFNGHSVNHDGHPVNHNRHFRARQNPSNHGQKSHSVFLLHIISCTKRMRKKMKLNGPGRWKLEREEFLAVRSEECKAIFHLLQA